MNSYRCGKWVFQRHRIRILLRITFVTERDTITPVFNTINTKTIFNLGTRPFPTALRS